LFGISASIISVRVFSSTAGLKRTTFPSAWTAPRVGAEAHRLPDANAAGLALGHGEAEPQRIHLDDRRDGRADVEVRADREVPLAYGAVERRTQRRVAERLLGEPERRLTLGDERAPAPRLLELLLVARLGDAEVGLGLVELGFRQDAVLVERRRARPLRRRLRQQRARLAHDGGLLERDLVIGPVDRHAEPRARLRERGRRLLDAEVEVGQVEHGNDVAAMDDRPEIHGQLGEPTGDLRVQHDLVLGGERAGRGHGPRQAAGDGRHELHRLRLVRRRRRRGARPSSLHPQTNAAASNI
jgi:hypothetical protein